MLIKSLPAEYFSMHIKVQFLPTPTITFFIVLLSIFSVVTFLCATHNFKGSQQGKGELKTVRLGGDEKKGLSKLQSKISSKALLMLKMASRKKLQDHEEEEERRKGREYAADDDADEAAVWKRTIIMGEKCRPLEFSAEIKYDSHGEPSQGVDNLNQLKGTSSVTIPQPPMLPGLTGTDQVSDS
ncbi:hypothetical protein AgCh_015699 [Apium graveolens]